MKYSAHPILIRMLWVITVIGNSLGDIYEPKGRMIYFYRPYQSSIFDWNSRLYTEHSFTCKTLASNQNTNKTVLSAILRPIHSFIESVAPFMSSLTCANIYDMMKKLHRTQNTQWIYKNSRISQTLTFPTFALLSEYDRVPDWSMSLIYGTEKNTSCSVFFSQRHFL